MGKELENINIKVGSRTYPVKVNHEEKSSLRIVEKAINDKIQTFKLNYAEIDDIDALSMTLLAYASELNTHDLEIKNNLIDQQLTQLEDALEKALS